MSIFTNIQYDQILNGFELGKDFNFSINNEKILGDVYSHTMYKEISTQARKKLLLENQLNKSFVIYKINNSILFIRSDGMVKSLKDSALIVYDHIEIKSATRFIEGNVNYCIDEVHATEMRTIKDLLEKFGDFNNFILIAHGEWKYFDGAILYYGYHIKQQSYKNSTINQNEFCMLHQFTKYKYNWSREQVNKF